MKTRWKLLPVMLVCLMTFSVGCTGTLGNAESIAHSGEETFTMKVQIGSSVFTATLEETEAARALVEMLEASPIVLEMADYSGFEKVGALGTALPASDSQTTTQPGDIVLYDSDQIVIFYGSNFWSYTRLGHIDDLTGWEAALGTGDMTVIFSLE